MVEAEDPRTRVAELPAENEEAALESINWDAMGIVELFHMLEVTVVGYDDYQNCTEAHYARTIEGLQRLVVKIQRENIFSANEAVGEIQTEHLKMLMVPYLEAEVLFRTMTDRGECVRKAHTFFLEYLKLMNHYNLLEKPLQVKAWKAMHKKHRQRLNPNAADDDSEEEKEGSKKNAEHPMIALARQMEDRDTKIANFKLKKSLEANLDRLKNYQDEEMKRDFYMTQIKLSIMQTFEQLRLTDMELEMLQHAASLTPVQLAENEARSQPIPRDQQPPLQVTHIGPDDIKKLPIMVNPARNQPNQEEESNVVKEYVDPMRKYKPIDKIQVRDEDINDRMSLKQQYQQQVFQPGHNLPTMSLEEFADMEVADALERQARDQEQEAARANEDPDDEEVLEAQRQKDTQMADWADFVPKGRGNTKRI